VAALVAAAGCSQPAPNAPGTLTLGALDDAPGLDPAQHPDATAQGIAREVFETLVRLRPGSFEVEGDLARSWSVSADGTTWTFVLWPGLKFSNGTPLDASAVKANLDRWRLSNDPNRQGLDYPAYAQHFGGFDSQSIIDDVRVDGPTQLVIHTRTPFAALLRELALPSFGIGSPIAIGNDYKLYDQLPVGSGRYRVSEYQAGDHVTLSPNPMWRGPPAPVPSVIVRIIPDPETAVLALEKEDVDAVVDPTPDVAHDISSRQGMHLVRWPSDALCYLLFDLDRPPFSDPRARRAVALALDRKAIAANYGDPAVRPARGWMPPGMLGADPNVTQLAYDPHAARSLLERAGAAHARLTLYYPATASALLPDPSAVAQQIQSELTGVGLVVSLQATDATELPSSSGGALALGIVAADSGDPVDLLAPLAGSWSDPAFVAGATQAATTIAERQRAQIYRRLDQLIADRVAAIPLVHPTRAAAVSTRATVRLDSALLPRSAAE